MARSSLLQPCRLSAANNALQRTLDASGACSARAANEFARASLSRGVSGAAERER